MCVCAKRTVILIRRKHHSNEHLSNKHVSMESPEAFPGSLFSGAPAVFHDHFLPRRWFIAWEKISLPFAPTKTFLLTKKISFTYAHKTGVSLEIFNEIENFISIMTSTWQVDDLPFNFTMWKISFSNFRLKCVFVCICVHMSIFYEIFKIRKTFVKWHNATCTHTYTRTKFHFNNWFQSKICIMPTWLKSVFPNKKF